jgi:hypothetical protein
MPSSRRTAWTHRVLVTPEQARRWIDGQDAIGFGRGEPFVEKDRRLIEHHGWPEDPDAEPVEPEVLGVPLNPTDPEAFDRGDDENPYDDEP